MDVTLLRWPVDAERRRRLDPGVPRLLLVEPTAAAPVDLDDLEDWIRVPAEERDVQARLANLRSRARRRGRLEPTLDSDGVVRVGSSWTSLPPVEARLTAVLIERIGMVVSREALAQAGWPEGSPGRNALDVHVLRLRRRLAPVGLVIRTVRSRGYLLEMTESVQGYVRQA
jgi:DNA-binding response OmpR family regulator